MYKNQEDQKTIETPKARSKQFYISTNRKRKCQTSQGKRNIWSMSASTMTRDQSPSHKIPKAIRFTDIKQDEKNNIKFLDLELRTNLDKGITFPKSKRKDNFTIKQKIHHPASTTYFPSQDKFQFDTLNPQGSQNFALIKSQMKSYLFSHTKGPTFKKFNKDHTLYLHHGRQMNYQPEITKCNPGVGKYFITPDRTRTNSPSYSFRKVLQRFNQHDNMHPGVGAYNTINFRSHRSESINAKGTFENSNRIFLQNPNNHFPGPSDYFLN